MTNNNGDGISRANFKYLFRELALDSATRKAGGILIIIGSSLGVLFGLFLISADPSEIISGQFDYDEDRADISGIIISSNENSSGALPVEGVKVRLLYVDEATTGKETFSDTDGRFLLPDITRESYMLYINHPGNITVRILLVPGDNIQIPITLTPGQGDATILDLRGDSYITQSATLSTIIAGLTLICGLCGISGGFEAFRGNSYRRTWWLGFIGLWSRGGIFIGPLFILIGMGLISISRNQFSELND